MERVTSETTLRIDVHVGSASPRALPDDVLDGLTKPFKELPPKHLYDARGAELFDQICELPEYYPTRAERTILARPRPDTTTASLRRRSRYPTRVRQERES